MRTVTLEILRNGPPNNQLLSPLTQYLVLCGNMPASTLTLPFVHQEYLLRMRNLQYKESDESRELEIAETARKMGEVLAGIPGLIRELKERESTGNEVVHLRLILSPNELALLPFELSTSPPGCPGAGQALVLQTQTPISLTREVRRVSSQEVSPIPAEAEPPRILFAAASPPGAGAVPHQAHLLALRRAIDPWLWSAQSKAEQRERIAGHLTVLPQASLDQIEKACATGSYTHVHILAHGVEIAKPAGSRFALALHSASDPGTLDHVEGDRLATALRTHVKMREADFARPLVVSLAACNAGDVGSVVGAAASIAHDLHQEGIPFVVASQFPLSFAGSVILADVLYRELLWGSDPRLLLVELRRALKTAVPNTHDWGSVVSYVSLPAALDDQLSRFRMKQADRALKAAVNHFDSVVAHMLDNHDQKANEGEGPPWNREAADPWSLLDHERKKLVEVRGRLEHYLHTAPADRSIYGYLASAEKRLAEVFWRAARFFKVLRKNTERQGELEQESKKSLERSRDFYRQAFESDSSQSWGLVQALVLDAALSPLTPRWTEDWQFARLLSERALNEDNRLHQTWAHSGLLELHLLAMAKGLPVELELPAVARRLARKHAAQLVAVAEPTSWEVHSTRRQLLRYVSFFEQVAHEWLHSDSLKPAASFAAKIWEQITSTNSPA